MRGRTRTSWASVRRDLENAGARWVDREVVVDENLITSPKPRYLETFCSEILARLESPNARAAAVSR